MKHFAPATTISLARFVHVLAVVTLSLALPRLAHAQEAARAEVHIESKSTVELEELESDGHWSLACVAPCDTDLALGLKYRIGGPGTRRSRPFLLPPAAVGPIRVRVERAATSTFVGGAIVLGAGGLTASVGAILALLGTLRSPFFSGDLWSGPRDPTAAPLLVAGLVTFGVGVVVALVGAVIVGTNARSSVRVAWPARPLGERRGFDPEFAHGLALSF